MKYKGFTQIPHYLLDTPCDLTPCEKIVLLAVYRLTAGYGRQTWRIKYSQLKAMTGIASISDMCKSLEAKKMFTLSDYENGNSYKFTIPKPPIGSGKRSDKVSLTPASAELNGSESTELNGYRGAIDSTIDNIIDKSIDRTLTERMQLKYPDKDINKAKNSFLSYPHHINKNWSGEEVVQKFETWCMNEKPSRELFIKQFKRDLCNYPIGWCAKCNQSGFYEENELYGDSKCCHGQILPAKIKSNA